MSTDDRGKVLECVGRGYETKQGKSRRWEAHKGPLVFAGVSLLAG